MSGKKEDQENEFPTEEELINMDTKKLKFMCNQHSIGSSGSKDTIVRKLLNHFNLQRREKEDKDTAKKEKEEDEKKEKADKKKSEKKKEPAENAAPTEKELKKKTNKDLKELCSTYGISTSGNKNALVKRILKHNKETKPEPKDQKPAKKPVSKKKEPKEEEPKKKEPTPLGDKMSYTCSLCHNTLTGEEEACPGCGVSFSDGNVVALFDSDWDAYSDIPTPDEVRKMSKKELKELCGMLGFDNAMSTEEMKTLVLELIDDEEEGDVVGLVSDDGDSFDPRRALEETNYIRDSLHKYTEALDLYDRIIEWNLQHNKTEQLEDALLQKGICLQYMNEFSKARECYVLAQEVNPKNPEIKALLMGVNALDKFYENKEQKNALDKNKSSLKDRILNLIDDGEHKSKRVVDSDYSPEFVSTQDKGVEMTMKPRPEPIVEDKEQDYTLPEDEGPGKDEVILKDMDEMSERLVRLKKLKDSIDLGDIESKGGGGAGIIIDNRAAKAQPIEEPKVEEIPEPPQLDAEIVEETQGEIEAEVVEETAEAEPEVITPEVIPEETEVEAEIIGEEPDEPEPEVEAEIVEEKIEPEVEDVPKPKKAVVSSDGIISSGNTSLDGLVNGGFPSSTNILISAPPFVGKEMILFEFIKHNLESNRPAIIVTTGDPIMVIRTRMNQVMADFENYENQDLVSWVDPRSETIREKFSAKNPKGPEDYSIILKALEELGGQFNDNNGGFSVVFISLTPIVSYREPKEIKDFLKNMTSAIEEAGQVGLYCIDSDMHDETEIELLEKSMSGIIEIKENQNARSKKDRSLIMIKKMPGGRQSRWTPFFADDQVYKVG